MLWGAEASITLRPPPLGSRALTGASPDRRHRYTAEDEETEAQVRQTPKARHDKLGSAWLQILRWGQCHKAQSPAAPLDSVPGCAQATLHCSDTR